MGISYKNFGPSAQMSGMKVLPPAAIDKHYPSNASPDPHWDNAAAGNGGSPFTGDIYTLRITRGVARTIEVPATNVEAYVF